MPTTAKAVGVINGSKNYGELKINNINTTTLGGISPEDFLRYYWQKQPLLIRNAIPGFNDLLTHTELMKLACDEDAQSRLVIQKKSKWLKISKYSL